MKQNRRIRISYKSSKGESDRVLEPLKLVNYTEIWYMLAAFNGKIQTFSLSRITGAAITDEDISFNDPDELEKVLSGYGIYHDSSEPRIYRIRFYGWAAHIVSAQVWQKDQKIKHIDSDTIELSIPITNDTELLSRILFYGDAADPLEPEDFVLQYREKCSNMAKRYEH